MHACMHVRISVGAIPRTGQAKRTTSTPNPLTCLRLLYRRPSALCPVLASVAFGALKNLLAAPLLEAQQDLRQQQIYIRSNRVIAEFAAAATEIEYQRGSANAKYTPPQQGEICTSESTSNSIKKNGKQNNLCTNDLDAARGVAEFATMINKWTFKNMLIEAPTIGHSQGPSLMSNSLSRAKSNGHTL